MADRIVLIDGHALVYRAFHALPPMTSSKGEMVNAVFGFLQMLTRACNDLKPKYLVAAFDTSSKTFRRAEFEAYKATRAPQPEGLPAQFGHIYRLLDAMHVPVHRLEGYEADDLLGTLSCKAAEQGLEVVILTGDMDALQLVGPSVKVLTSRRGFSDTILYDEEAVRERFGLEPKQLVDFKALRGDTSDNIPGVPGIGDKTASKLLGQYQTVENLYEHLADLPEKQRLQLEPYHQQVTLSKRLATIVCDLDAAIDLETAELSRFDPHAVRGLLHELGFGSLIDRLPQALSGAVAAAADAAPSGNGQLSLFGESPPAADSPNGGAPSSAPGAVGVAATVAEVAEAAAALAKAGGLVLAVQGSIRDPMRADLVGVAVGADATPTYLPLGHAEGPNLEASPEQPLGPLTPLLGDDSLPKYAHDVKTQMVLLGRCGVEVRGLAFDTMIAAYLLARGQRSFDLRNIAWDRFQEEVAPLASLVGTGKKALTMREVPVEQAAAYAAREVELVGRLAPLLRQELAEVGLDRLYRDVELPMIPVLAAIERVGVAIDVPYLNELSRELYGRLQELERDIYTAVGHEFNIGSSKQLSALLYDELNLPRTKRTSTGQGSTGADVLEALREAHPCIGLILEHRQLAKLKSTYVDALPILINPDTGRVHTTFNQAVAATGRLSSSDPNLQNIPIRTELGRRVRRAFIPGAPGCKLLSADYSQIELRILAHETEDPRLLEAFREGLDIHAATAAEVQGVEPDQVTPDMRRFAKIVNFGVLYGMSEFGLASRTELPQAEAGAFIQRYFERFGTVKEYQDRIISGALKTGYAETLLGRRRFMPDLKSPIHSVREAARRQAINHPIQGAASDIMKIAMIRVHDHLRQSGLQVEMILQVHDELVFEGPEDELRRFVPDLRRVMMGAMELKVPLNVELKLGANWDDLAHLAGD